MLIFDGNQIFVKGHIEHDHYLEVFNNNAFFPVYICPLQLIYEIYWDGDLVLMEG